MKTLIAAFLIAFLGLAHASESHVVIVEKQTIKYDPNGPYGRQLISTETQRVLDGTRDANGFHKTGERTRSVATVIPLDK